MKEARKQVITAARFTLLVVGPASLIAGIILPVSNNDAVSSIIFFSVLAVDLLAAAHWSRRQTARQEQKRGNNAIPGVHMTVHEFIAHVKMHPELLPAGMTEFDLERFRKLHREPGQEAELDNWVTQLACGGTHGQHAQ